MENANRAKSIHEKLETNFKKLDEFIKELGHGKFYFQFSRDLRSNIR